MSLLWSLLTTATIPHAFFIKEDEVHVWQAALEQPAPLIAQLRSLLSDDERQRAHRFHFPADQRRYVVGRGVLRLLLGAYLVTKPEQLRFGYNAYGKPELSAGDFSLQFNLSHSGEIALYAMTHRHALGIDIECIRSNLEWSALAQHVFSPHEQAVLAQLPVAEQLPAFFRCWSRKEAFIKARGMGLSLALDQFDVTLAPTDPPRLLATRDDPQEASRWTLCDLPCPAGFAAALAVAAHGWRYVYAVL